MTDKGAISGLILQGTRVEGKLEFKEKMRIDGDFVGQIKSPSQLIVGKSAKVNAEIDVGELIVMGEVSGQITRCDSLQIQEQGKVLGDITVGKLDIRPGAIFNGKCVMMGAEETKKSKTAP